MAEDNARPAEESGAPDVERKLDRSSGCRLRDQRALKVKDRPEEIWLPTPPPDPQCPRLVRDREVASRVAGRSVDEEEEEEDLAAYLGELGASPFEGHSFDYDTPNSATSAMGGTTGTNTEEAFEHLDRLCALTEQILELRDRSSKYFRRVRELERVKTLRNADRRLEMSLANDEDVLGDFPDEDTGFAESLLDAMLSNCRQDPPAQRRNERANVRSPSSRQRSRSLALAEQTLTGASSVVDRCDAEKRITARIPGHNGGPKISKWTRVKAAFKWERACANDLAEIAESNAITPSTRYLRIPDVTAGSWSGSTLSPCISELSSPSTPIGRVSSASSSNEEVFDESRRNVVNYSDRQTSQAKDDRKKDDQADRCGRSFDRDTPVTENTEATEFPSETNRGKPLIRIISDADVTHVASGGGKDPEVLSKRLTPILTITIPSNEEEIRSLSSPESMSPLASSAQDSGGSSPQHPKMRQDISSPREFKRQYSTIEETVTPAPKIQRQDSKWNKVRRAFLTNATFSVPPSPVRVTATQSFASDGTNYCRSEALRDYQALREKFGAEFHRKLIEWERLKSGTPRVHAARNSRDGLPLNEERLAPEFRKKLQDWKRTKKSRRTGATSIEQQRVSRRRLTDWQLWRSSSKPESRHYGKNQNSIGSRDSCASIGSAGSFGNDGKQHLCEDFVKRMEAWRRMSEAACKSNERPKPPVNRVASDIIDETEFLALEKLLLLFGQKARKEHRESDAKQLNDCFDGDARFTAASRGVNCGNEVLIRTSVGSYRFEGISREFTRKLYDWEKYRGISPRSSTFRLLGPGYTPFARDSEETTLAEPLSTTGKNRAFHWTLKRSKSDGSIFDGGLRDDSYTLRRSTSLHSLISADKLEDDNRIDALAPSNNPRSIKDLSENTAVEDSEPEAMIVDIEDVIEETASPLKRVQPHQTPVYSVAASETTSIAVPLGTVTSSHEPSPVFLVEAEDEDDCGRWNSRRWIKPEIRSNKNSPSSERFSASEDWREKTKSPDEDKPRWQPWHEERDKESEASTGWIEDTRCSISDSDSVKFDQPTGWNRDAWDELGEITQRYAGEANRDSTGLESPLTPISESSDSNTKKQDCLEDQDAKSAQFAENFGSLSMTWHAEELTDSACACNMMKETRKIEDLTDESNNGRKSNIEDHEDGGKSGRPTLDAGSHTYNLTKTLSSSDCLDSRESSLNLSNLNLDDDKNTTECGADTENETLARYEKCDSPELQADIDRHYEILTFKTDTCGDTDNDRFLYEPINCHEARNSFYDNGNNRAKGSLSLSSLSETENPSLSETTTNLLIDTTLRTIPVIVPRDNDARSLERIVINEETLNKIIVPTACAENGTGRHSERLRHHFTNVADSSDEAAITSDRRRECDHASTGTNGDRQVACVKKDGFSSKNVFVKTKRMIFGPFRRSEDRPSTRKESDGSVDGRLVRRSKSKSKSRSASPKLHRQDALLRVSLSLPWPLRSNSRENEVVSEIESRRSSAGKVEDAIKVSGSKSPCVSVNEGRTNDRLINSGLSFDELNQSKTSDANSTNASTSTWCATTFPRVSEQPNRMITTSIERDVKARQIQNDEVEYGRQRDESERHENVYSRIRHEEEMKCDRRQDHAWQQEDNCSTSDAVPSDLMHKLRILSDAAAKREGRAIVAEADRTVISSSESRSSRIRRAKESFLSRRGGPFCSSMMDPTAAGNREDGTRDDPWRRASMSQVSTIVAASKSNESAACNTRYEEAESAGMQSKTVATISQIKTAGSSNEDKTDAPQEDRAIDVGLRADLVKSASAGMINVDPDTFGRLIAVDRGCESLPRTIAKRRDTSGPLAKIVGKLKLSRLIRTKNIDGGNMSTISTLCRQSLLIDTRSRSNNRSRNRETESDSIEATKDKDENKDLF